MLKRNQPRSQRKFRNLSSIPSLRMSQSLANRRLLKIKNQRQSWMTSLQLETRSKTMMRICKKLCQSNNNHFCNRIQNITFSYRKPMKTYRTNCNSFSTKETNQRKNSRMISLKNTRKISTRIWDRVRSNSISNLKCHWSKSRRFQIISISQVNRRINYRGHRRRFFTNRRCSCQF